MKINVKLKSDSQIYQPGFIKEIISSYNISLKKRFGQNFLINRSIAENMVKLLAPKKDDRVVEIGPGLGAITLVLARNVKSVLAFEIDRGIYHILSEILKHFEINNVELINEDFMKLSNESRKAINEYNKFISNFPYSSGQRMLIKIIEDFKNSEVIVGSLQREVADRFISAPGSKDYGFTSVWIQLISHIEVEKNILPGSFFPRPEVESSIIKVIPKINCIHNIEKLKKFIKCCFASKRKSLLNNLLSCKGLFKNEYYNDREILSVKIKNLFGDVRLRSEQIKTNDFIVLFNELGEFLV